MNITPAGLQLLFQEVQLQYQQAYDAAPTVYQQICTEVPSRTRETHYGWMDKIPMVREWLGPRVAQNVAAQSYTLRNRKWELTLAIKREDIEDEQMELFSAAPQMLGEQTKIHPDILCQQVIEAGTANLTFDNAAFFSASHPIDTLNAAAGTQSNLFTSGTSGAMPLNNANLAAARTRMRQFKGRDGQPLGINMTHILVPPALEETANVLQSAELISPGTAAFGTAAGAPSTNTLRGTFQVIVSDRLTSDTAWYPLCLNKPIKPFVFQNRKPVEFTFMVNPNDPNVWNLDEYQYGTRARYNVGYGLWFLAAKCDT
jgi:phage major head subunit gpT-like protein